MYMESENLGDDIQSYAAMQFLPRVDYFIDRESMDAFLPETPETVKTILNGWYLYDHLACPPSEYIHPLLTSIHFDTKERPYGGRDIEMNFVLEYAGADFLRRNGPVGARDFPTYEMLQRHSIDSYFSSCLTLTLTPFPNIDKTNEILLVDACWDDRLEPLRESLGKATGLPVRILTHYTPRPMLVQMTHNDRMMFVETRLKMYQSAQCVVTTRLHCALPCLALGTPVILIKEESSINRIGTFYQYFDDAGINELTDTKWINFIQDPPPQKSGWEKLASETRNRCIEFINEKATIPLPNWTSMEHRHIKRRKAARLIVREQSNEIGYLKDELEKVRHNLISADQTVSDADNRFVELSQSLLTVENKLTQTRLELTESQNHLYSMKNATFWKLTKPIRKILDFFRR